MRKTTRQKQQKLVERKKLKNLKIPVKGPMQKYYHPPSSFYYSFSFFFY